MLAAPAPRQASWQLPHTCELAGAVLLALVPLRRRLPLLRLLPPGCLLQPPPRLLRKVAASKQEGREDGGVRAWGSCTAERA